MTKVLIVGSPQRIEELQNRAWNNCEMTVFSGTGFDDLANQAGLYDLVIDLNLDEQPVRINAYKGLDVPVIVAAVKVQLAEMGALVDGTLNCTLIGMNCLSTFIDRPVIELSLYNKKDEGKLNTLMADLGQEFQLVEDRVGMVTPRILFMIMNEACYTLQEGTASIPDIDLGMKLGTSFPYGPFEWADRIGLEDVYTTLEAVYDDTKDERYKICPLLKTKYLRDEIFIK